MATSKKSSGETLFDLTSYVAATPASPSQQQANATAQTTHDTFGLGLDKPLASYDLNTQSWKMYEDTFLSDSMLYLGKWPASGMTQSGRLFPQPQLVRLIAETVSSLWRTPTVDDSKNVNPKPNRRPGLVSQVNDSLQETDGSMRLWPTPTTQEIEHPTAELTQTGRRKSKDGTTSHSLGLADAVQMWPTPKSTDYKAAVIWPQSKTHSRDKALRETIAQRNPEMVGGRLNPMWVEWLMGFPLGWTDLED
jgi:hypothetical protein